MCFSANASFIVATGLGIVGGLSLLKAHTREFKLLALSPILLGIQQALEGLVWIGINTNNTTSTWFKISAYGFQFFAAAFWPFWIPYVLYLIEHNQKSKGILGLFSCIGFSMCLIVLIAMLKTPLLVEVIEHHLNYPFLNAPMQTILPCLPSWQLTIVHYSALAMYVLITVGSCFVSTTPGIFIIGILFTLGYVLSSIKYPLAFASTWCFFAAISSLIVYHIVSYNKKLAHRNRN